MTTNRDFKQVVRARAQATGERYTEARAALTAEGSTGVDALERILDHALVEGASDIHLVPDSDGTEVRIRVEGRLRSARRLASDVAAAAVTRLKSLAGMDPDESHAQTGRLVRGEGPAIRVSTLPTATGEKVTMRFVREVAPVPPALARLGFGAEDPLVAALRSSHGLIVVEGDDLVRRTATISAIAETLATPTVDVVRISSDGEPRAGIELVLTTEDPARSTSVAMHATFRSDPDIIVIDRIETEDEADVAMQLVTTGHLVVVGVSRPITSFDIDPADLERGLRCVVQ